MSSSPIKYDHAFMVASCCGGSGLQNSELKDVNQRLKTAYRQLGRQRQAGQIGFLNIPKLTKELAQTEDLAKAVYAKYRTLIVIGIGGSDLGARALLQALRPEEQKMDVRFIGANTDPEEIAALLRTVDLKRSVLNIVSKSGDTIEPMATFLLLRDRLIKAVGKERHWRQVVATTDPVGGTMRMIANRERYRTLPVPQSIGGRYSALTPVGLFPAACAGIRIKGLVAGAKREFEAFFSNGASVTANAPLAFAGLHHAAYTAGWGRIAVLMPYAAALKDFGAWFAQLWAESLGKEMSRGGRRVNHGQTPIAALGATDQHSQIQLFNEGPKDKAITFIEVEKFRHDLKVPRPYPDTEGVSYLGGHAFSQIIHAERQATAEALRDKGRPNGTVFIPEISPETVGGLMAFFMLATATAGELLDVNAYDQPGVEGGKKIMYRLLGRPGF